MKQTVLTYSLLAGMAIFILAVTAPTTAEATRDHDEDTTTSSQEQHRSTSHTTTDDDRKTEVRTKAEDRNKAAQTRLTEAKLKACQKREQAVTKLMTKLADRGQKQIDLFSSTAERTQTFYANKGNTLANYNTLVSDVAAKKIDAQAAIDSAKSTGAAFKCQGDNPKGKTETFKSNLRLATDAVKSYKTAVKNLIVGVKSAQGTTSSTDHKVVN